MRRSQCKQREGRCRGDAEFEQAQGQRRKPAILRRLFQADLEACQHDRHQHQRRAIERRKIGEARFVARQQERRR